MHIHCRFLPLLVAGAILAQDLPTGLLQAQTVTATRWVISALHPDPTPALGAPDCEYIALHALPDSQPGGGTCRTDGLVLSWNGHERELPDGTLVNMQGLDLSERQGEWTWTGEDSSGNPVPPGGLVWDVRWWGRTCRGRFREHLRVPGRP